MAAGIVFAREENEYPAPSVKQPVGVELIVLVQPQLDLLFFICPYSDKLNIQFLCTGTAKANALKFQKAK